MNTNKLNDNTMKINYLNFKKQTSYFLSAILCFALLASCSSDDDGGSVGEPNEEEVITDVTITFVNDSDATDVVELKSVDGDGEDGPLAPIKTVTGNFTVGETYTATLEVYNSIEDEDITVEITDEEPDEHFFIYAVSGLDVTFERSANDIVRADGNKLGFETSWTANTVTTPDGGSVTLQLFHESETVNDDNEYGTQTGGSTDIDITFSGVKIQ